jgi:hypothetical protein
MKDAENLTVEQVSAKSDQIETENLTKESSLTSIFVSTEQILKLQKKSANSKQQ